MTTSCASVTVQFAGLSIACLDEPMSQIWAQDVEGEYSNVDVMIAYLDLCLHACLHEIMYVCMRTWMDGCA